MKRKVTVVLLALVAALLLGLSVFFVACDVGTENGGQNTEQGGTDEEQGDGNEGETGGETGEDDGIFVFALNNEGTAYSVIGMDASAAGSVTIPATYNDLPVTGIGDSAFSSCRNLTEITIPEGVTSIGAYAFRDCSNLTKINYNAMAVSNLSYNSDVFYDAGSNSQGCTVTVGESVKSIPAYLFADADITSVTIGSNVESIGSSAFYGCSSLTSVTIGEGVTSIGSSAFRGCSNLTEINYNAAAVADLSYDRNVFYNAGSNSDGITVTFGESVKSIPAYLFCAYSHYDHDYYSANIVNVTIGSNVESIGSYAFAYCSGLTEVTIGAGVTSIGSYAFRDCSNLTEINYNAAVVADLSHSSYVFYNVGSNSDGITVTFGESVTSIPAYLFENASANITSVTIGGNVESIGSSAFFSCSNLTEITIPESVTSIGERAFYTCSGLTEITIPESVTSIGSETFYGCYKLIEVYNQSALNITAGSSGNGYVAYYAKHVYTQEGGSWFTDTADGYRFFYDGSNGYLMGYYGTGTVLSLPAGFTAYDGTEVTEYEIYTYAFYNCNSLKSVAIPSSVTSIDPYAFYNCRSLTEVTIPEGVTSIGSYAFSDCSGLTELVIPEGVTSIGSYAFSGCSSLTEITIPEGVTSIGASAFENCSDLMEITIPEGVTSIGRYAFCGCSSLTGITIPEGVTSIGRSAFLGCSKLTSVTFEITEGWWRSTDSTATSGTEIASIYLANPSTAARYLTSTYSDYYWHRS